jgi:hypothetical protein
MLISIGESYRLFWKSQRGDVHKRPGIVGDCERSILFVGGHIP